MRVTTETASFCADLDERSARRRWVVRGLNATTLGSDKCWVRLSGSLRFGRPMGMLTIPRLPRLPHPYHGVLTGVSAACPAEPPPCRMQPEIVRWPFRVRPHRR